MKRIWNAAVLTLALNFVVAAAGVGWLASSGHLTRGRMAGVRRVLFPPPATRPSEPTARPAAADAPDDPVTRLGALVARAAALPPGERIVAVQQAQEMQAAELDRRRRDLQDLRSQVELAESQATTDRDAVVKDRQAWTAQQGQQASAAADKGFQDSLALYQTLPARQVKAIFTSLPDETVQRYLQAMDARQAGKIMKEYKSPEDVAKLERVLERIRQARAATATAATDPNAPAAAPDGR